MTLFSRGLLWGLFLVLVARDVSAQGFTDFLRQSWDPRYSNPGVSRPTLSDDQFAALSQVLSDSSNNRDTPLSLHESLSRAVRNTKIVRVVDGSNVSPNSATEFDVETFKARAEAALAAFDMNLAANVVAFRGRQPPNAFFGPGLAEPLRRDEFSYGVGVAKPFVTGGQASLFYDPNPAYLFLPDGTSGFNPSHVSATTLTVRQPLLNGGGIDVNSVPIRIAQIKADQTAWDFKKAVMSSVRSTIEAYWELYSARKTLKALDEVGPLLEEIVRIQESLLAQEWAIEADVAKAEAQLYFYRQQRQALQSRVLAQELRLRNLMGVAPVDGMNIIPQTAPSMAPLQVDQQYTLQTALNNHPDLVRQGLNVQIREQELLAAQNGLLPKLDFEALYRLNGIGEDLGSAFSQMSTANFSDWQLGATYSMPLGRRKARSELAAAELQVAREKALLQQSRLSTVHDLGDALRKLQFTYLQYQEARQRIRAGERWLQGARTRYQNPLPVPGRQNWIVQYLNDYLSAVWFRTDAIRDAAALLSEYNGQLARLEEVKGTLLESFDIHLIHDPCRQGNTLPSHLTVQPPATGPASQPGLPYVLPSPREYGPIAPQNILPQGPAIVPQPPASGWSPGSRSNTPQGQFRTSPVIERLPPPDP